MSGSNPADWPLRDIHLPSAPGWWPPAPGWWWIALLAALLLAGVLLYRRARRRGAQREALRRLARLERDANDGAPPGRVLAELSVLLRRLALSRWPRAHVAGLAGEAWTRFLADTGGGAFFRDGPGRLLAEAPYARESGLTRAELHRVLAASRAWIRRHPAGERQC